jgi:uncharacterized membrane protein
MFRFEEWASFVGTMRALNVMLVLAGLTAGFLVLNKPSRAATLAVPAFLTACLLVLAVQVLLPHRYEFWNQANGHATATVDADGQLLHRYPRHEELYGALSLRAAVLPLLGVGLIGLCYLRLRRPANSTPPADSAARGARVPEASTTPLALPEVMANHNIAAALGYLLGPVAAIVILLLRPYRDEKAVRFHAVQSLLFYITWISCSVLLPMCAVLIPRSADVAFDRALVGAVTAAWALLMFAGLVTLLALVVSALARRRFVLPGLGALAARLI